MGRPRPHPLSGRTLTPVEFWSEKVRASLLQFAAVCLLLTAVVPGARASVALLLEQPYGGFGHVNPAGHVALYFDHICAASPVQLRPCGPGEQGVVISRYDGIDHRDWVAIPLLPYLYAVNSVAEIPETMDRSEEAALRDAYRRQELQSIAPDREDGRAPEGNWYELIGSAYDRTLYGFRVKTTPEQDAQMIAILNDGRNVERYNGAFRNCADFARVTINRLYPHAIRRNFVADLGLTSPKQVARGLTHYASRHPEVQLQVFVVPQVKGSLPRSHAAQGLTESLIKRYGVPLVVLSPVVTAVVFVAYMGRGRFHMPEKPPVLDLGRMEQEGIEQADVAQGLARSAIAGARPSAAIADPRIDSGVGVGWPLLTAPSVSPAQIDLPLPGLLSSPASSAFLRNPAIE